MTDPSETEGHMMNNLSVKKAVITGPTGALGTALAELLLSKDIDVFAVCNPDSKRIGNIPKGAEIVKQDLDDIDSLGNSLPHDCDAFFHLGWKGTFGESRNDMYLQTKNIDDTLKAVDLSKKIGCDVFVHAGSQAEFGHVEGKLDPGVPCNPVTGYGIAKLASGMMGRELCRKNGMRHVWFRILSLYGPHDGEHSMVMSTVRKMLAKEHLSFTKGDQIWDYLYSKDAAEALFRAAGCSPHGSLYCLGSGEPRRLSQYIEDIRDHVDPELVLGLGELPYYPNQVMHLEADISNLTADTGFVPSYSFDRGITETIEWAKANPAPDRKRSPSHGRSFKLR